MRNIFKSIVVLGFFLSSSSNLHFHQSSLQHPPNPVANAMIDVIRKFNIANDIKFDFIIYGPTTPNMHDVIDAVVKEISNDIVINIQHIKNVTSWNHEIKRSAIFFVKSNEQLVLLNHHSLVTNKPRISNLVPETLKFLVYVDETLTRDELAKNMKVFSDPRMFMLSEFRFFEIFMINDENHVNLIAYQLYSEDKCASFTTTLLNTYDKKSQMWRSELKNYDHFDNFHGCLLSFTTSFNFLLYTKEVKHLLVKKMENLEFENATSSVHVKYLGLIAQLTQMMAERANFSAHFTHQDQTHQKIIIRGTMNFSPQQARQLIFVGNLLDPSSLTYLHWSQPFGHWHHYYLVTKNDKYTNYEKLLMPFDVATWLLLFFTFGLTFGIIFGLEICPRWIRRLVIGAGEIPT
jgi:hypothetical protein